MITLHAHALNRVVQCNGSVFMPQPEVPDEREQSDDAREGEAAHWLAMEVISGRHSDSVELVDRQALNGVWITPEMSQFVDGFIDDVRSRNATPHIEETVNIQLENVFIACRLDLATYDATTATLTVDEFKYGFRTVEPVNNWQLVAEAMGWCIKHQIAPARIILNIHQPRPHHADGKKRSWEFATYDEFYRSAWCVLVDAISELDRICNSGPYCYKCPARANCEAARRGGYNMVEASGRVFDDRLTDEELAFEYDNIESAIKHAENLRDAYKELLTHRINQGRVFQNYAIEPALGNTRWKPGVKADMIAAISKIPVGKFTKTDMVTPAQAIRAKVPEMIVKAFTERPSAGFRLVRKSADKRAAAMFKPPTE